MGSNATKIVPTHYESSEEPLSTLCSGCNLEGKVRCSGCHAIGELTRYCSIGCQKIQWITHKNHCGKAGGIFVHPHSLPKEIIMFYETMLELAADYAGEPPIEGMPTVLQEIASCFSPTAASLILEQRVLLPAELNSPKAATQAREFLKRYAIISTRFRAEEASFNSLAIRTFLNHKSDIGVYQAYKKHPRINPRLVAQQPLGWFMTSSNYNFLFLQFRTTMLYREPKPESNSDIAKSLWGRVIKEAESLRSMDQLKWFQEAHDHSVRAKDFYF